MSRPITTEEFIRRARKIHGDTFDYSKSVYVSRDTPVLITCRIHGDFWQTPNNHYNTKHACKDCAMEFQLKAKEEFIKQAKEKFGDFLTIAKLNIKEHAIKF